MEIVCKCGYHGNQMVVFETQKPHRQTVQWNYSNYYDVVDTKLGDKTLNWACPKCGRIFVRQVGGESYDRREFKDMIQRLRNNSWANEKWIKGMEKVRLQLKELNNLVTRVNRIQENRDA